MTENHDRTIPRDRRGRLPSGVAALTLAVALLASACGTSRDVEPALGGPVVLPTQNSPTPTPSPSPTPTPTPTEEPGTGATEVRPQPLPTAGQLDDDDDYYDYYDDDDDFDDDLEDDDD